MIRVVNLSMVSKVLGSVVSKIFWGVSLILGNRYGLQEQNYVALLQGSEMPVGLYFRNLITGT